MKKYYGKCKILGDSDFTCYFEYKHTFVRDKNGEYEIVIGKDVVTNTTLYTMIPSTMSSNLEEAAIRNAIKRGKLIIENYEEITINEMKDFLDKITDEEIEMHLAKLNEIKAKYLQSLLSYKASVKKLKTQNKDFTVGSQRIRRML